MPIIILKIGVRAISFIGVVGVVWDIEAIGSFRDDVTCLLYLLGRTGSEDLVGEIAGLTFA